MGGIVSNFEKGVVRILEVNLKNYRDDEYISMGVMPIRLEQVTYLPRKAVSEIEASLKASNKVISELILGLTIKVKRNENTNF